MNLHEMIKKKKETFVQWSQNIMFAKIKLQYSTV